MKRIKSVWIRLLVTALSIAMIIGCFGGLVLADEVGPAATPEFSALHATAKVESKVKLGESFGVPAAADGVTLKVTEPNGEAATVTDGKCIAENVGNYTIEYSTDKAKYCYVINCYEENDYFIYVADGGASIPTYFASGDKFDLPEWYLAYTNEDGEVVRAQATETKVLLNGVEQTTNSITFPANNNVTYTLTLGAGFNESKLYYKEYVINVQNGFADIKSPTLKNIANMPSSASLKTKVDLPKATAEDDYDDRVLIDVTVTDPSGAAVKQVNVNDNGYAESALADPVDFDNDETMSFYPMENGTYTVTYMAKDDAGNESAKHEYRISVSDKTGPVITDIDDSRIPNVWGLESVADAEGKPVSDTSIYLPIPSIADNHSVFATGDNKITLEVEIKNPNTTVARFTALTSEDITKAEKKIDKNDSTYGKYFKDGDSDNVAIVNNNGTPAIKLNLGAFYSGETTAEKTKAGIVGTWTVTYKVKDAAGNGGYNASQKSYTINVKELAFTDTEAPEIETPSLNDYIIVGGEETEFTVPNIAVSDDNDARLLQEYNLVCGENNKLAVKGGEKLEIVKEGDSFFFVNEDETRFELKGDELQLEFTATDDAGNSSKLVKPVVDDEEENYSIRIYKVTGTGFIDNNIVFEPAEEDIVVSGAVEQSLGGFTVSDVARPEFLGYELALTDGNGDPVKLSAYMYYVEKEDGKFDLHVGSINCLPAKSGAYMLTVRIFDAMGNSRAFAKTFNVEKNDDLNVLQGKNAVSAWESNASVGSSYSLRREATVVKGDNNVAVYKIEGYKFQVLGFNFTPLASGGYTVREFHGVQDEFDGEAGFNADALKPDSVYGMTATDSKTVIYDILGTLPTYSEKYNRPQDTNVYQKDDANGKYFFVTDPFVAYSDGVSYDIELTYTKPSGNSSNKANKVYEDENGEYSFDKNSGEFLGRFALVLDEDGAYTITVKAVGVNDSGKTYTMKVGDITKPQFTLDTKTQDMKVGDTFKYRTFEYIPGVESDPGYDRESDIRVSYKLIEPGSSSGGVSSVSASNRTLTSLKKNGSNIIELETSEYVFSKSGNYTVVIEMSDAAGNVNKLSYTISVNSTKSATPTSLTMLSTVLIIVGVLLILGVIVYLIRFRKRRA